MENVYAVLDSAGNVVNTIVADPEFIASGALDKTLTYVNVTAKNPRPGPRWTRAANGKYVAPPDPQPDPPGPPDTPAGQP